MNCVATITARQGKSLAKITSRSTSADMNGWTGKVNRWATFCCVIWLDFDVCLSPFYSEQEET